MLIHAGESVFIDSAFSNLTGIETDPTWLGISEFVPISDRGTNLVGEYKTVYNRLMSLVALNMVLNSSDYENFIGTMSNNEEKNNRVQVALNSLSTAAAAEYRAYKNSAEYALSFYISSEYVEAYDTIMTNFIQKNTPGSIYRTKDLRDEINKKREELGDALGDFAKIQQLVNENVGPWYGK